MTSTTPLAERLALQNLRQHLTFSDNEEVKRFLAAEFQKLLTKVRILMHIISNQILFVVRVQMVVRRTMNVTYQDVKNDQQTM